MIPEGKASYTFDPLCSQCFSLLPNPYMKRERDPTREEFDKFLLWLDSDRNKAAVKLEQIEARLMRVFVSRGCVDDDALKDEVINRVATRIDTVRQNYPDALRCCLGFVDNVHREYVREQKKIREAIPPPPPAPAEELEREDQCLRECMGELTAGERSLLVSYFQGETGTRIPNRKILAKELRLSANALRCQAHRLRKKVRFCLKNCLNKAQPKRSDA